MGTINRRTSYDSDILQDYEIIRGLPTGSPSGYYIYRIGPKEASLIAASDQTVRTVHSCKSWLYSKIKSLYTKIDFFEILSMFLS